MSRLRTVIDVAENHLCTGCGACAFLAPTEIMMVDDLLAGRRPLALTPVQRTPAGSAALEACPGRALSRTQPPPTGHLQELGDDWGPVLELWEGWATDPEIRFRGSSGGAATALALHCLQHESMAGVLHTAARLDVPYLNETVFSTSRSELLARAGSRYAPASPCDGLDMVVQAEAPCVFIGKPCDVAGARRAARLRPELDAHLGLTIAVFCAGTPTTAGTLEAIHSLGLAREDLKSVSYRGEGWPGRFKAEGLDGRSLSLSYEESWGGILQRHRQWRCMICPDHTGEFADISVGDPWYQPTGDDPGRSLVVVRTERGRRLLRSALRADALRLVPVPPDVLPRSQPNLVKTGGAVWGRVRTMRLLGRPAPNYVGMPIARQWRRLSRADKLRSTLGTARRLRARGLLQRRKVSPWTPPQEADPA